MKRALVPTEHEPPSEPLLSRNLEVGTLIAGRYEVVALLGEGGMGVVLHVIDHELGEDVALKFLREEFVGSREMLERFRSEVRLARRVTHRNVARTFDLGVFDGLRFITMELVRGASLSPLLARGGRLPLSEVLRITSEIARGLVEAHAVGVVHRDLKPANVLLSEDRVVITDFGIACLAHDVAATTEAVVGTPAYMAPEQIRGGELDGRADVYALGAMMFRALTGHMPFPGNRLAQAAAAMTEDAPDARERDPSIPRSVADAIRDAMARDRGLRLDAQLFLHRVQAIRGGRSYDAPASVRSPPPGTGAPTLQEAKDTLVSSEADELYLRGKKQYLSMNDVVEAVSLLERANALRPGDPAIMSALGAAMTRLCFLREPYDRELNSKAEDFALRALAADSGRGETFNTIGILRLQQGDVRAAAHAFREALVRTPQQWEAHAYLGGLLCETLRVKDGLQHIDVAIEGEPRNVRAHLERGRVLALMGDRAGSGAAIAEMVSVFGKLPFTVYGRWRIALWWNDLDDALAAEREITGMQGGAEKRRHMIHYLLAAALDLNPHEDVERLVEGSEGAPRQNIWLWQVATEVLARRGFSGRALDALGRAAAMPLVDVLWMDRCPLLVSLRGEPRFAKARALVAARAEIF